MLTILGRVNSLIVSPSARYLSYEGRVSIKRFDPKPRSFEPFPFAITQENKDQVIRQVVEPLHGTSYEEQLVAKESYCKKALRKLASDLYQTGTPIRIDIRRLPCNVNSIVPSPLLKKFRHQDDFSIWRGVDGETETIGFMAFPLGRHGDTICIEPDACENIRDETKQTRNLLQRFISQRKLLPVCYELAGRGGWRRFCIKVNSLGEIMISGYCSPRGLRVKELVDEKENFKNFVLEEMKSSNLNITSLYFQPCPDNACTNERVPYELLYGHPRIKHTISGLTFNTSPDSYVPANIPAANNLFKSALDLMDECFPAEVFSKKPIIIDIGCGVGLLSLNLADRASQVVGVDHRRASVADAETNAKQNGIENCQFINANAEVAIEKIIEKSSKLKAETMVACYVTNNGLHKYVSQSIRECANIKKILYITPKIGGPGAMRDLMTLCRKDSFGTKMPPPFIPVSATPVDMLPHTEVCDLVLALERLPE